MDHSAGLLLLLKLEVHLNSNTRFDSGACSPFYQRNTKLALVIKYFYYF